MYIYIHIIYYTIYSSLKTYIYIFYHIFIYLSIAAVYFSKDTFQKKRI